MPIFFWKKLHIIIYYFWERLLVKGGKFNEKIMIIPYESGKINYDKAMSYEKENIEKMKDGVIIKKGTYEK